MYNFDNVNQDPYDTYYPIDKMLNIYVDIDIQYYSNNNLDENKNIYLMNIKVPYQQDKMQLNIVIEKIV